MFTGIIETIGKIYTINRSGKGINIEIKPESVEFLNDVKEGDSVSVNGVCLTIVTKKKEMFTAHISPETFNLTSFKYKTTGEYVNLEKPLRLTDRLHGHIITGHIDGIGESVSIKKLSSEDRELLLKVPHTLLKYIVYKGSIGVDGISLTVAEIKSNIIKIAIIPFTFENTTLKFLKPGSKVNIETDIFAKYIEKFLK